MRKEKTKLRKVMGYARAFFLFYSMIYIGVLIALIIFSVIVGSISLFGAMRVRVSASLVPEFSLNEPVSVVTASQPITWTSDPTEHAQEIKKALSEPNGWILGGLNYRFLSSHARGSGAENLFDIIFLIFPEETIAYLCENSKSIACASQRISDTLTVPPIKLSVITPGMHSKIRAKCTILMSQELLNDQSPLFPFRFVAINHEVGHCLGFKHSKEPSDIMSAKYNALTRSPSQKEIDLIKTKLTKK